jgi:hypothetical protein
MNAFFTVFQYIRVFPLYYKSRGYKRWHDSSMIYSVSIEIVYNPLTVFQGENTMTQSVYDEITASIVEQFKKGATPWIKAMESR